MNPQYAVVARRAGHRCEYCHAPEVIFNFPFEVEHVQPTAHSGSEDDSNLCLSCRACNARKSDRLTFLDVDTQLEVPLFNPRQQRWTEHFVVDPDTGEI